MYIQMSIHLYVHRCFKQQKQNVYLSEKKKPRYKPVTWVFKSKNIYLGSLSALRKRTYICANNQKKSGFYPSSVKYLSFYRPFLLFRLSIRGSMGWHSSTYNHWLPVIRWLKRQHRQYFAWNEGLVILYRCCWRYFSSIIQAVTLPPEHLDSSGRLIPALDIQPPRYDAYFLWAGILSKLSAASLPNGLIISGFPICKNLSYSEIKMYLRANLVLGFLHKRLSTQCSNSVFGPNGRQSSVTKLVKKYPNWLLYLQMSIQMSIHGWVTVLRQNI